MSALITPVQPLILTGSGTKPTIPTPSTINPNDERFDITTNVMVGQLAYNVDDDIWYYRHSTGIKPFGGGEITVNDVETWQSNKIYRAGNVFVSYVNAGSTNPQFQTEAIYRCDTDTAAGESPETHEAKWIYQGESVDLSNISAANVSYNNDDSGLAAENVKAALDELAASIALSSSTGNNVGTGEGVYKDNSASVLNFRSIKGTGSITVSTNGDDIEIDSDGEANTLSNLGSGVDGSGLASTKDGVDLPIKRIKAGDNMSITEGTNSIELDASVPIQSIVNAGTGQDIFISVLNAAAQLKGLLAGTNITLSTDTNKNIVITCNAENNTASNIGSSGIGVFSQKVAEDLQFKNIAAGSNISISEEDNIITITSDGPIEDFSNEGGGTGLFKEVASKVASFKTLAAGSGISISDANDVITITSSLAGDAINDLPFILSQFDNTSTADGNPGTGKFRLSATKDFIYINTNRYDNEDAGIDISNLFLAVSDGSKIYAQCKTDSAVAKSFNVTGDPVNATTYIKIPVSVFSENSEFGEDDIVGLSIIGGAGGSGVSLPIFETVVYDNISYTVVMTENKTTKLSIPDGTTALTLLFSGASSAEEQVKKLILDNSANASNVAVITLTGNWESMLGTSVELTDIAANGTITTTLNSDNVADSIIYSFAQNY